MQLFKMKILSAFIAIMVLMVIGTAIVMKDAGNFTLTSKAFFDNQSLPQRHTYNDLGCKGKNLSPHLKWENAPLRTKSFAVLCHDPDAPKKNGWWHWLVVNIPSTKTELKEGERFIPPIQETINDFGSTGYGGACPPVGHGTHHYNFTVYALDVKSLDVLSSTDPETVKNQILEHTIKSATITATYQR